MKTFTFAAAALIASSQALRLANEASHADLLFAEFEAKHNKNYLSQKEREERKVLFLQRHDEVVHLHPRTSYVGDNFTNDFTPEEMDNLHGIIPADHKKPDPPRPPTLAELERYEQINQKQMLA